MYFCRVFFLLSTFLLLNILYTEYINAKINPYQKTDADMEMDKKRGALKIALIVLMSIFGAIINI